MGWVPTLKLNHHSITQYAYDLCFAEPSPLYDNNHYHEECLRCNSCGLNLTGPNQKRARRFKVRNAHKNYKKKNLSNCQLNILINGI